MFDQNTDARLSAWAQHRAQLDTATDPLQDICDFWRDAPFVPVNPHMDPYFQSSWPTPWEIIVHNQYDDFTKAVMMAWTLKLTSKFAQSCIQIHTMLDNDRTRVYNIVVIEDRWVLNYDDAGPATKQDLPNSFLLENLIEVKSPR
jgi:hypothetical protein